MSSIDCEDAFEQYYQNKYDFNTTFLSEEEIDEIKKFAKEKRVDYNLAPLGTGIFDWILKQNSNIRFELVNFDSDDIDGMLYIPNVGKDSAYIILNANKPLINQIFTAAHEYYHYEKDYASFKAKPYVCNFKNLKDVNEKKACRFAAELLLPEVALRDEVMSYCKVVAKCQQKDLSCDEYAVLSIALTVKYQMPLKAVLYRLFEEGYIKDVDKYIQDYEFIKGILKEITILEKLVAELYGTENKYIVSYSSTYQDMEKTFRAGNATREEIISDAKTLNMNMQLIHEILAEDEKEDDVEDNGDLFVLLKPKRG